jgi:hypothetical protein
MAPIIQMSWIFTERLVEVLLLLFQKEKKKLTINFNFFVSKYIFDPNSMAFLRKRQISQTDSIKGQKNPFSSFYGVSVIKEVLLGSHEIFQFFKGNVQFAWQVLFV